MAHCPYEKLSDIESVLNVVRTWNGIREPKPGVFYFKRKPFLHFHTKLTERWAHIRSDGLWEKIDSPMPLSKKTARSLEKAIPSISMVQTERPQKSW